MADTCEGCEAPLPARKRGRRQLYCSDACRKAAARGSTEQSAADKEIVAFLRGMTFVGQLWPVYRWDDSSCIMALIVPRNVALDEVQYQFGPAITEADLKRALSACNVYDYEASAKALQDAIKDFYAQRKDRRIGEGYTPSDNEVMAL